MILETLNNLFTRDLNRLKQEIELYTDEANLWKVENGIANSGGNLCLHLIGNLSTYIGNQIGKVDYIRDRPLEFSLKDVPRKKLVEQIEQVMYLVNLSLKTLSEEDLENEYPILFFEEKISTGYFLVHLTTHLTYHLGQINYHRRLIDIG